MSDFSKKHNEIIVSLFIIAVGLMAYLPIVKNIYLIVASLSLFISLIIIILIYRGSHSNWIWSIILSIIALVASFFTVESASYSLKLMGAFLIVRSCVVICFNHKISRSKYLDSQNKLLEHEKPVIPIKRIDSKLDGILKKLSKVDELQKDSDWYNKISNDLKKEIKGMIQDEIKSQPKSTNLSQIEKKLGELYNILGTIKHGDDANNERLINEFIKKLQDEKVDFTNVRTLRDNQIRKAFLKTFLVAESEIDIISPWISKYAVDENLLNKMENSLKKKVTIKIIYGYSDSSKGDKNRSSNLQSHKMASTLKSKFDRFGERFKIKQVNTHEKLLLCDERFYLIGSYNLLSFGGRYNDKTRKEIMEYSENRQQLMDYRKKYFDF